MPQKVGVVLILLGLTISVISPYAVLLIGIPIYGLGLIFLWMGQSNTKVKLYWSLIPLLLWFPLMSLWLYAYNSVRYSNRQKKDYYINHDFRGSFTLVESNCGIPPIVKNNRLQFDIPSSGIYLYDGELKSGYIDERIFVKNKDGTLKELELLHIPPTEFNTDTNSTEFIVAALHKSFGKSYDSENKESTYITLEIKTNKIYSDTQKWLMNKEREKLLDSLVNNCLE